MGPRRGSRGLVRGPDRRPRRAVLAAIAAPGRGASRPFQLSRRPGSATARCAAGWSCTISTSPTIWAWRRRTAWRPTPASGPRADAIAALMREPLRPARRRPAGAVAGRGGPRRCADQSAVEMTWTTPATVVRPARGPRRHLSIRSQSSDVPERLRVCASLVRQEVLSATVRPCSSTPARGRGCGRSSPRSPPRASITSPSVPTTSSSSSACCCSAARCGGCWRS